jgi:precorrin-6B C5,15-methyltransferase / cobalt-precorrin-6B C5,C15-methyltransferase
LLNLVHVVGLGMSPADLSSGAHRIIREAQVLVGGRRLLNYFPDHPAVKIPLGKDPEGALRQLPELAATRRVVVLASGDPNFYGVAPLVVKILGDANVVIHPNITAVQAACARLQISWQDAQVISLHGRGLAPLAGALERAEKLIIYTDPENTPAVIAAYLLEQGRDSALLWVLEDLGQPTERVTRLTPAEARTREFSPLNLVVVLAAPTGRQASPPVQRLYLGLPEEALAHEAGLITKSEVRAVVLAKLELSAGQVLWDLGAGCGSVSLEASLLLPGGRIMAVERDPARVEQIRANRARFGMLMNLEVVAGVAPDCLAQLPQPQRVFVGGGGAKLNDILQAVLARLEPGGKVVLTAALLETLESARRIFAAAGWPVEVVHLQVSRARPLAEGVYLQALNPVWIISGRKPGVV